MSGRRRRSESLWDSKEEAIPPTENSGKIPSRAKELHSSFNGNNSPKWSNLEATDALMSDDFSGQPSWEPMQGNENLPADNDISRDRCRMPSDPAFDEWENQYSSRPSDDSYGMQYRVRDRGVVRTGSMSSRRRNRSRSSSRSPKRNRSMSRDRGPQNRGSYGNRKDSELDEEAINTAKDAYFCNDFVKGRNVHDDQERQQSNRDSKEPCKFFAVGKCNRKHCKFSHDILESGGYDVTLHDNIQGHDLGNKNLTWNDPQLRDDLNASGFSDLAASNRSFDGKNKLWSGPSWDEVESGGFNEISHDEIPLGFFPEISQPHNLDPRAQHVMPEASGSRIANAPIATIPEVSGISGLQQHLRPGDDNVAMVMDESNAHNVDMVSKDANQQNLSYRQDFIQNIYGSSQLRSNLNGTEQSGHMLSLSPLNGLNDSIQLQGMFLDLDSGKQVDIQNKESGKNLESNEQIPQVSNLNLPSSLPQMSQNITNAIEFLNSLANSASCGPPIDCIVTQQNLDEESNKHHESARDLEASESTKMSVPMGVLEHQKPVERFAPNSNELCAVGAPEEGRVKNSKKNKQEPVTNLEGNEGENTKHEQENVSHGGNDEKAIRLFKAALVEFVKEILKPTWKEGKMSREVYKTVVKKVVDKVTSTIQGTQIPKTQERIDQYLAFSKSKITKLVEAYVERFLKA